MTGENAPSALRLDKWLWFARFARTRAIAAKLCGTGRVAIGETRALKAHQLVRVGDRITIEQGRWRRSVVVRALGERRGPASEARLLYDEPDPPAALKGATTEPWEPLIDLED